MELRLVNLCKIVGLHSAIVNLVEFCCIRDALCSVIHCLLLSQSSDLRRGRSPVGLIDLGMLGKSLPTQLRLVLCCVVGFYAGSFSLLDREGLFGFCFVLIDLGFVSSFVFRHRLRILPQLLRNQGMIFSY